MSLIEVKSVAKKYGRHEVLKDVSFYANTGECVGIVGANGCGKSTLLKILSGSIKPDSGSLVYDGADPLKNVKIFERLIGYVPQENPLMTQLSVMDNLNSGTVTAQEV